MLALVVGCTGISNGPAADPAASLDEAVFRCNVEPILVRQCSYTACHGIAGAALRVYSPGKLRAVQPVDIDNAIAPLTDGEQHANFESAAGFSFMLSDPLDNFLLRKPLPPGDGGYEHLGGVIYKSNTDPQYLAIKAWITKTGTCK